MKKREFIYIAVLTLIIAFMDMTGIPSAFFVHIQVADIEPVYFTLMVNFLFIGVVAYLFLRTFVPAWDLGFRKKGLVDGLKKYGIIEELYVRGLLLNLIEKMLAKSKNSTLIAVVLSAVIFGAGHIFGVLNQPLLVIVSKVVWTIGMGMFFGMVYKKTNNLWLPIMLHFMINVCALPYCFSSINGYADLTLYIVVPVYIILGIYSFIELKKKREFPVVE